MVQVDLPAAFTIGQVFALLSKEYLRREERRFANRLLGPFNVFMSCCYAPVGMFLLVGWPAWEVMYRTAWVEQPYDRPWAAAFYVAFGVVMVLLGNVGFILGHHWLRQGRDRWVVGGACVGAVLTVLPFLLRWGIWLRVGPYAEVQGGGGYSFWESPFHAAWLGVMGYMVVTAVGMGIWLKVKGSRLAP